MAAVRAVGSQPNPLHIYGGRTCNLLMADWWSDRSPLHEAASQGRLLLLRSLVAQVQMWPFSPPIITHSLPDQYKVTDILSHLIIPPTGLPRGHADHGWGVSPPRGLSWRSLSLCQVPAGKRCKDAASADGATPLFNSCRSGSAACVGLLLQHGASVHSTHQLASPMHEAAKKGAQKQAFESVLPSFGSDPMLCSHQITESVWSCCWPAELSWTRSCRKWAPHFILPVEQERLPVWRCCCLQVQMLALDAGGTVLSMPPFREGIWVWWSFCWTLGQTPFTEIQKEGLLWICLHQTARLDLLCREEVCGKRFIRQSVFYKLEPSSTLSSLLRSVLSVSAVPLLHPQTSWTESSAPSPQPFPASQDARLPPLQLMHHLLYLLQTQKCENQSI
ncbi:ankyrin repeat and SOCS box protein 11 isoform X2 [Oryzias latipes]